MKTLIVLIFSLLTTYSVLAQPQETQFPAMLKTENELSNAFDKLYDMPDSPARDTLNREIIDAFRNTLKSWDSFFFAWDKLKYVGIFRSDDNLVRVYTWFLESENGAYSYYGFVQHLTGRKKKKQKVELFELNDRHTDIKKPELAADLSPDNWYGCLYYGIHAFKKRKNTWYALFGYDFNNQYSHKKFLDVLTFNHKGKPSFGGNFILPDKTVKRFILEYSSEVVMYMRFDPRLNMIVFDHIEPFEPIFKGNYRFYGPDGSYDGFKFDNGDFVYEKDVDARNF